MRLDMRQPAMSLARTPKNLETTLVIIMYLIVMEYLLEYASNVIRGPFRPQHNCSMCNRQAVF